MKRLLQALYVFLIISLIAIIVTLIILCIKAFDCKNISQSLSMLATTFTAITSSLSVIIATLNIRETKRQFQKSKRTEVFNHWYKDLIIDRHLQDIKKFFDMCENLIDSVDFEKEHRDLNGAEYDALIYKRIFTPFTSGYTDIHRDLITDVSIIDTDLSKNISNKFSEYQDDFAKAFDEKHVNVEELRMIVKKYYRDIIYILMKYEHKIND